MPAKKKAPGKKKPSPEARLKKLKKFFDQGLITKDEYAKRKSQILAEV